MTTNQTIIFRRFDDVHVQLLLCLQDEISELETKLNQLDGANMTRTERTVERMQVIRELRRLVTEYGEFRNALKFTDMLTLRRSTLRIMVVNAGNKGT